MASALFVVVPLASQESLCFAPLGIAEFGFGDAVPRRLDFGWLFALFHFAQLEED